MRKTFADTMLAVGRADPKLVVLVGDISHFALQPFAKACPGRFYNIGILEPTMVSMAAGLAMTGLRPVVHTIAPFLVERSFEQIKLDFCYQGLGGTLVSVGSAFDYSGLGCSHHCYGDLGIVKSLPNTQVLYPAMPNEFTSLFRQTYQSSRLTYIRLPGDTHGVSIPDEAIHFGKGVTIANGKDITIVAAGPQLKTAIAGAELLRRHGVSADILYIHTVKPFDDALVRESCAKTGRVLVIEEHSKYGGVGDDVLRSLTSVAGIFADFINIPDSFQRGYGQYEEHLHNLGFTPENVAARACALIARR